MAHWQIALAYAKYLSPEFHMWCNTVVRERMEGHSPTGSISPNIVEEVARTFGIVRMLAHKVTELERAVVDIHEEHLAARRLANGAKSVVGWKLALTIAEEHGVPQIGRAAKVRALLVHIMRDEWRGPEDRMDWEKANARALLGEFAGMSEDELAAV